MAIQIMSAAFTGIKGVIVTVEIDITRGLPALNIVGLADVSVKESKERVRSAILNSGFDFPVNRITINLAPADLKKEGSLFDLPIAIGILLATKQLIVSDINDYLFIGELSLSGKLKKVRGSLPVVMEGIENKIEKFIVPTNNARECSLVKSAKIFPLDDLNQVVNFLNYKDLLPYQQNIDVEILINEELDYEDVMGQESSKRAIEVAAAGGHNLLMYGPPGCGKSMMAKRIPTILPSLSQEESLEVTKIYSVSGKLEGIGGIILQRPFRSPHHTISRIALVGGGNKIVPGEISLAHKGVLFLDEILEFKKDVIEILRQPLEERKISISRINGTVEYPSNFMFVSALNPCPCGYYGSYEKQCSCSDYERRRYLSKLSAPLLDRIDIFTAVNLLPYNKIISVANSEKSVVIKGRVEAARNIQEKRFSQEKIHCNAEMSQKQIKRYCRLENDVSKIMELIYDKFNLSTRAYSRILKVARTIADLDGNENISDKHIIEAMQYRKFIDEKII
ncbi:YifB family Mg chelatase-like AAA ATPase [Clostridium bowmanii]|uniref:YifB family Mg chelatase-like AAA ATPase n=1 Tax=Clostridium bowmanii TaxID=132925 RepID=UPI001C0C3618|nr:YifB family Mg chelatase-like AAA ATPase [Clostridium bowmanii]MBU3189240.1 YifB family Mg chelatase-like AAA ATPase [Clostridium bowmanii]MCA1073126.1 YifB family Mg chelatase-like AAA ATPase [Clostridium bowmanii]